MSMLEQILANGGSVKMALEDRALLEACGGEATVDEATELALAKAKVENTPDPVEATATDVLTVSNELSDELEGQKDANVLVESLEAIEVALKRANTPLDFAVAYECYNTVRQLTHLGAAPAISVESLDNDLEAQRTLALEGLGDLKNKVVEMVSKFGDRMAGLVGKSSSAVVKAGNAQEVRSKSLLGKLFNIRTWNPEALVKVPESGLKQYGKAATNPSEFGMSVVGAAVSLFDGGDSAWNRFVDCYIGWARSGSSDVEKIPTYSVPEKITAKLPLRPRVEKNVVVFDKPEPVSGEVTVKVGDKTHMKNLLQYTTIIAKVLTEMDKYFGNLDNHWTEVKKKLSAYIESKADDEYFQKRTVEDYKEIERRIEAAIAFFIAMAHYLVDVNAFLLEFATAAVAAGEASK